MHLLRTKTGKVLVLVISVLALATVALLIAVSVYANSAAFRLRLLEALNSRIAGRISIVDHHLSLLFGSLTVEDLSLKDQQDTRLVAVDSAQVRFFLPAFLWREIRLNAVEIEGLDLQLVFDRQNRLKIGQALASKSSGEPTPEAEQKPMKPWQVSVEDFRLLRSRILFERPAVHQSGRFEQVRVYANGNLLQRRADVRVTVGRLDWQQLGITYSVDELRIEAQYADDAPEPLTLSVKTPKSNLSLRGRVPLADPEKEPLDLVADLDLGLAELQPWLPAPYNLQGRLKGRLSASGPLNNPVATAKLQITEASLLEMPISQLTAEAHLQQRQLTLERFHGRGSWGDLSLSGNLDLRPLFPENFQQVDRNGLPAYELKLQGTRLQPQKLPPLDFPLGGTWQLQAEIQGRGLDAARAQAHSHIQIDGADVRAVRLPAAEPFDAQAQIRLRLDGPVLTISQSRVAAAKSELNARGSLDLDRRHVTAQASFESANLAQIGRLAGVRLPEGPSGIELDLEGPWRQPKARVLIDTGELTLDQWHFGRITADARLEPDGEVQLSSLELRNRDSRIAGSGTFSLLQPDGRIKNDPEVKLDLTFEDLQIGDFQTIENLEGVFNGHLAVTGTANRLSADLKLDQGRLRWQRYAPRVSGRLRFHDDRLTVSRLQLATGDSSIELAGSAQIRDPETGKWSANPILDIRLTSDGLRLEDFFGPYAGRVAARADVKGPLADLRGRFKLNGADLDLGVQTLDSVNLAGNLADRAIVVDRAEIAVAPGQQVTGSGRFDFDRHFQLSLDGSGIDLVHITALQKAYPVQGLLALDISGHGSLEHPVVSAGLRIAQPRFKQQAFDDFQVDLQLDGRDLNLAADLNFKVAAQADLGSGAFDLRADFDRTQLDPYLALGLGPLWNGRLSGSIRAAGNWNDIQRVDSQVALADAVLLYNQVAVVTIDQFKASLHDSELSVPGSRVKLVKDGYIDIRATGNLQKNVQVSADGRLALAALSPFSEVFSGADGDILLSAEARGPLDGLQWETDLEASQVDVVVPGLLQLVENINGRVHLTADSLRIESLTGKMGPGGFTVDGQVRLKELRPDRGRITFKANAMPVVWPDTLDMAVNGELNLTGSGETALLAGELTLVEGTYYQDVRIDLFSTLSRLTEVKRAQPVPEITPKPQWMEQIKLDIDVTYRNPLLVDNNLARLEIVPDLAVNGTLAKPVITGQARVVDGQLTYRRTAFEVTRGVIDFVNPYRIEPTLDIQARAKVRDWDITLALTGPLDRLALQLSSDPPESDSDILALLLVGRTSSEIRSGEGGSSQSPEQMLAGLAASEWGEDIRKKTGLDILEVETGSNGKEEDEAAEDRIQLTLGKRLSRRLTLKYEVEHGDGDTVQRAISEYRLLEHLLATGFQDSQGGYGGELLFRINFR